MLVKGKGNFAGTLIISYNVLAADFADSITEYDDYLTVDTPLLSVVAPDVKVNTKKKNSFKSPVMVNELVSGKKLKAGKDYSLTYTKDNEPVPEGMTAAQEGAVYTVKITGMAPFYTGSVELEYQVVGNSLPKVKGIAALNILYLGDEIIFRPKTSADDTDYNFYLQSGSGSKIKSYFALEKGVNDDTAQYRIISYRNNIKKGTATIVIRGINGYAGAKSVTFKINAQPIDQTLYK